MNLSWLIPVHRHLGETLLILPLAVVLLALLKGKTLLPRITAVLLDIQFVLGIVTFVFLTKVAVVPHVACMFLALGLAHAFAKKDNRTAVAGAFAGVFALLLVGYLVQKGVLPGKNFIISL